MPVEIGVLSTTTPSCHAVNRCVAIEISMSIPETLLGAGFCLSTTSRRHSADGSRTRRTRTSAVASGSACARTIRLGEDAGDDAAQTETIARTAAAATSRKRMIPLPCSQRELNTGHGIDGLENRQCPNGQFFPVSVRNAETNQLQVAVRGGGGNRTPVLRSRLGSISGRSRR